MFPQAARADDFRPAYLQVTQLGPDRYEVLWKSPALSDDRLLKVRPQFPAPSQAIGPQFSSFADGVAVQRWTVVIPGGLEGKTIHFPGLSETRIDVLARLMRSDGGVQLERILAVDPKFEVNASPGPFEVVQTYAVLGIEHILLGFDHLCFVLALILIVRGTKRLIWTVTAFTVAHSITLALATLQVIQIAGPPVEATIALSIIFVAHEIIEQRRGREGLASRQPWLVAFAFGLLHGLGFAGALAEVGLPADSIPLALLFFNVGVEVGQLLFVAAVLLVLRLALRLWAGRAEMQGATVVTAYAIGGIASYWLIERVAGFWG
jgi:hypothetical protein